MPPGRRRLGSRLVTKSRSPRRNSVVTHATGITGSPGPGNGDTAMAARGFSGHGLVMQLFDGTRLYAGAGTVTFPFDTWSIDRIEVLRGAASVIYGEGAIGGVINVVPKKPMQAPIRKEALLTLGSDATRQVAFGSGGVINDRCPTALTSASAAPIATPSTPRQGA